MSGSCGITNVFFILSNQFEEKTVKKEESRDEDENEDDSSTANPEEYDPLEADDADDDEDDGKAQCSSAQLILKDSVSDETSCTTLNL